MSILEQQGCAKNCGSDIQPERVDFNLDQRPVECHKPYCIFEKIQVGSINSVTNFDYF
jgi:hypothetical protein